MCSQCRVQKFKDKPLPTTDYDALSSHSALINRAIAMHLLREGQFSVASTFLTDATNNPPPLEARTKAANIHGHLEDDLGIDSLKSEELRRRFANMYHILHQMKNERNLLPAILWARENSQALETRGSNLEFELGKLQFVWLFTGGPNPYDLQYLAQSQQQALQYARSEFTGFQARYLKEIQKLSAAMAFSPNLGQSPYRRIFHNDGAWEELANSFTREFCSLLGLSADSPLYIAATAGAIALPTLLKLQTIMKEKRTEWTTQHELPVSEQVYEHLENEANDTGRNTSTARLSFPFHLRVPGIEGTRNGSEPTDDDALRTCRRARVVGKTGQRVKIQMSILSQRESAR